MDAERTPSLAEKIDAASRRRALATPSELYAARVTAARAARLLGDGAERIGVDLDVDDAHAQSDLLVARLHEFLHEEHRPGAADRAAEKKAAQERNARLVGRLLVGLLVHVLTTRWVRTVSGTGAAARGAGRGLTRREARAVAWPVVAVVAVASVLRRPRPAEVQPGR